MFVVSAIIIFYFAKTFSMMMMMGATATQFFDFRRQ